MRARLREMVQRSTTLQMLIWVGAIMGFALFSEWTGMFGG